MNRLHELGSMKNSCGVIYNTIYVDVSCSIINSSLWCAVQSSKLCHGEIGIELAELEGFLIPGVTVACRTAAKLRPSIKRFVVLAEVEKGDSLGVVGMCHPSRDGCLQVVFVGVDEIVELTQGLLWVLKSPVAHPCGIEACSERFSAPVVVPLTTAFRCELSPGLNGQERLR